MQCVEEKGHVVSTVKEAKSYVLNVCACKVTVVMADSLRPHGL